LNYNLFPNWVEEINRLSQHVWNRRAVVDWWVVQNISRTAVAFVVVVVVVVQIAG
jgi:hypothetical protein